METLKQWMKDWKYPTSLLCIYGFFTTVKPLEPFLIPFFTGPDKNLTIEQVTGQIFPVWTYSYLAVLVPVFLLTDWLRYKPVVVFQCLILFATTAMLLWCKGVPEMQAVQFTYGVVTSCDVAYFTYIYSMVELKHYLKATSYCRTAQLLGYTAGSVLGQLLVSFDLMSYSNILVLTLVLTGTGLVVSILLPMPKTSMFFHKRRTARGVTDGEEHDGFVKALEPEEGSMKEVEVENYAGNTGSRIAAGLNMERYALVFGANTFCALVLQTIITSVVVDQRGLGLDIVT
ncbi:hypothetical protein DNTS_009612, partial [Danionella cerebrum]